MPVSSITEHWIKQGAVNIELNFFGDPDYLQVSTLAGAVIMAFKTDVIGYNAAHNYRSWPLEAAQTHFEDTDAFNVYARLTRDEINPRALIIYDPILRDIEGREINYDDAGNEVLGVADPEYFYIYLGQISASVDNSGNKVLREWVDGFNFGSLDTDQYRRDEESGAWAKMFKLNSVTDLIDVLKTISSAVINKLTVAKEFIIGGKSVKDVAISTDSKVSDKENDTTLPTTGYVSKKIETLDDKFLRKDKEDSTAYKQRFLGGIEVGEAFDSMSDAGKGTIIDRTGRIQGGRIELRSSLTIGKNGYAEGFTGFGGRIDEDANAELESLRLRRFLEVPELRFNRIDVKLGDKWNAPGAGIIERVEPDVNADGTLAMTGTAWLKLEDGEYGAIAVGDICMGIFHSLDSSMNATEDYDSADGIFQYAGFYTCYFTITDITGADNKEFRYQMRPTSEAWRLTYHPSAAMTFVSYGSFTDPNRMSSQYTTRTYTRLLVWQNSWEIKASNIAMQWGDLSNLAIHGINMQGYSAYLNNIYMTGVVKQLNSAGNEIHVANDRGEYVSGTHYDYYDRVSYDGGLWLCVAEGGTNTVPSKNDSAWLNQVPAAQGITSQPSWDSSKVPYPASTILKFADRVWISNKETSAAPLPLYTDPNGNYYKTPEGGYYIASETQSADWDLLLDSSGLVDGEDGASIEVRYSADGTNWHFPYKDGDIYMQQRIGSDSAWSDIINFVGADGKNGSDGQYAEYQFAVNDSLTIAPTTGWQDTPPTVGDGQYLWMRMRIVDPNTNTATSWSVARIGGEEGTSVFKSTVFFRTNNTPSTPEGGSYASPKPTTTGWSDGIPEGEQILWASTRVFTHNGKKPQEDVWSTPRQMTDTADFDVEFSSVENPNPPQGHPNTNTQWSNESGTDTIWMATSQKKNGVWGEWKVSKIKGEKGDMGVSITTHGQWKNGKVVPVMGIVTMAGNSYIAKIETSNPPLWCYTDPNGNYYLTPEGGYYLTGEDNTAEYDLLTTSGKDGNDGKDYEWIYQVKATADIPSTPNSVQQDDYVPSGWNDDPTGVSETLPYEFASFRTKKDGKWSDYSTPAIWAKFGKDGQNAIYADMDNEMDSVALTSDGKTTAATELSTTVSMWNGSTKATLKSISISQVGGVTTNYTLSSGLIKFNIAKGVTIAEHNEFKITVVATINGVDESRTLTFTLNGVKAGADGKAAVLYKILLSVNAVTKKSDGTYSVEGVSATRMKIEDGVTSITSEGKLKYLIDDKDASMYETEIGNAVEIPSFSFADRIRFTFYSEDGYILDRETVPMITDGAGFKMMGNWKSGLSVPVRGVVQMGGSTFVAKKATSRPPLFCYTDPNGNYYLTPEGGYYLTGESNTEDYETWAAKGDPGKDGSPGVDGVPGADGKPGAQGYSGCVTRTWDTYLPTQKYRNDKDAAPTELEATGIRYLDVLLVESTTNASGYEAYECVKTCVGSNPVGQSYNEAGISDDGNWRTASNLATAFIAKFIALDANIKFAASGQLVILDELNKICAGMSGRQQGKKTRIWAGGEDPDNAPFRVNQEGQLIAKDASIEGKIVASNLGYRTNSIGGSMEGYALGNQSTNYILPTINGESKEVRFFVPQTTRALIEIYVSVANLDKDVILANVDGVSNGATSVVLGSNTLYTFTSIPNYDNLGKDGWFVTSQDLIKL